MKQKTGISMKPDSRKNKETETKTRNKETGKTDYRLKKNNCSDQICEVNNSLHYLLL
jgi:hypothetical protein